MRRKQRRVIWQGPPPGASAVAWAVAWVWVPEGFAWAFAAVTATCPVDTLDVIAVAGGGLWLNPFDDVLSRGRAYARAKGDPFVFEDWNDEEDLEVELTLSKDTWLQMPDDANVHPASLSKIVIDTGTSIPPYSQLFEAVITASLDGNSPTLDVNFTSNPLLGLDDYYIAYEIANAFRYDDANGGFVVDSSTKIVDCNVDIPSGVTAFEFRNDIAYLSDIFDRHYSGPETQSPTEWCGNGIIEDGEQCDPPGCACDEDCYLLDELQGDIDDDGTINFTDFAEQGYFWQVHGYVQADVDGNGVIDIRDLAIVAMDWLEETSWYPCSE